MTCTTDSLSIPRGASFAVALRIPDAFADGFFANHTVTSEMRTVGGALVAPLTATWADATTRILKLEHVDTAAWPLGLLAFDVVFEDTDGRRIVSRPRNVAVAREVTKP